MIEDREYPIDDAPLIHQSAGPGASNARDVLAVLVANGYIKLVDAETYAVVNSVSFVPGTTLTGWLALGTELG